jgi:hypothetical protein
MSDRTASDRPDDPAGTPTSAGFPGLGDGPRAYDPPPRRPSPDEEARGTSPQSPAPWMPTYRTPAKAPVKGGAKTTPPPRPPRVRRRRVDAQEMRDVRARLRGTIYEGTTPAHGHLGDLYSPRQIVDFCLDLGEVMLASGADVRTVEVAIVAVGTKWNLAPLELDITGTRPSRARRS